MPFDVWADEDLSEFTDDVDTYEHHPQPGDSDFNPLLAGAAYALYRHGQDRQTADIARLVAGQGGAGRLDIHVHTNEDEPGIAPVNALEFTTSDHEDMTWDRFIGQAALKRILNVAINSAKLRGETLDHVLLASVRPGVGKTTVARLIAKSLGGQIIEMVPPFNVYTIVEAASQLNDGDVLFIDEVHLLCNNGKKGAEILPKILEDWVAYLPDGRVVQLPRITIIAATTEADLLPEPVLDRFGHRPGFAPYSEDDLIGITVRFAARLNCMPAVDDDVVVTISEACRDTPRVIENMVVATRDLALYLKRNATSEELLTHLEVQPDGLTRAHVEYITALRKYFGRVNEDDEVEYLAGEAAMQQLMRESEKGINRIERFLIERRYLDKTPRGRRLTERGITKAEELIAAGKGLPDT
ncbi:AAA family ATPase [Aquipuribacter sp. MA13-6]|uniref:AAA family ATPase n=1 Tax=unclassified Aquipuribacter TaxID=2635084 RepID=UPI003EEECDE9